MLNFDEDLDTLSVERLRELRDGLSSLFDQVSAGSASFSREETEELDELFEAIEERLADLELKAS